MAYLISLADVWSGLIKVGDTESAVELRQKAENLLNEYAKRLADKGGFITHEAAMEEQELGGLLIAVYPASDDQPLPECIRGADSADEWAPKEY